MPARITSNASRSAGIPGSLVLSMLVFDILAFMKNGEAGPSAMPYFSNLNERFTSHHQTPSSRETVCDISTSSELPTFPRLQPSRQSHLIT